MACLFISIATFVLGILYIALGYHVPVGFMQVFLGALSTILCIIWFAVKRKDKKNNPQQK